jgi:ectoine hydroxylase-related dioxygenase (phytanoyl-CoA dioxygenase family)
VHLPFRGKLTAAVTLRTFNLRHRAQNKNRVFGAVQGGGDEDGEPGGGNDVYHGVARVGGVGGRVIPPDTDPRYSEAPIGYLAWHRDEPPPAAYPLPKFRNIKGFVYLWPCDEQGGAGAVVPGSHLLGDAPGTTLKIPMASGYNERMCGKRPFSSTFWIYKTVSLPRLETICLGKLEGQRRVFFRSNDELPHSAMPNHVPYVVNAGDAVIFDTAIWHTALPNASDRPRCTVTMSWVSSRMNGKQTLSDEAVARMEARDGAENMWPFLRLFFSSRLRFYLSRACACPGKRSFCCEAWALK